MSVIIRTEYQSVWEQEFVWVFDTSQELAQNELSRCHGSLLSSQIIGVEYPHCRSNSAPRVRDTHFGSVFSCQLIPAGSGQPQ